MSAHSSSCDYALHYWPLPFRGQFIRAILAHAGKTWNEFDAEAIDALMSAEPADQPVPFMGPPVLIEHATGIALAQMPAIACYLGDTLELMPPGPAGRAMALKVVNDANDVIDELTLNGGMKMWTARSWQQFIPRLEHWMTIFETTAARHGVTRERGFLLGGESASIADIVTATLWSTMAARFPALGKRLDKTAPLTAALAARMAQTPALAQLAATTQDRFGDAYCGGQIEKSLRAVVN
ncbi:glutathione S-transferase [soil metagenome]